MSRRQISLIVVSVASLVLTACGTSTTAPQHNDAPIVTVGSGG